MSKTVKTYVARRRMQFRTDHWHNPAAKGTPWQEGDIVPEAHVMFRVDSWLHSGHLGQVEVPVAKFRAALNRCDLSPAKRQRILHAAGLGPAKLEGPRNTPVVEGGTAAPRKLRREFVPEANRGPVPRRKPVPRRDAVPAPHVESESEPPAIAPVVKNTTTPVLIPMTTLAE